MSIRGVVDRMVAGAHYRPYFAVDAIMNICRPQAFHKDEGYVSGKVDRHNK